MRLITTFACVTLLECCVDFCMVVQLKECSVIPQLANSDHLGLRVILHGHAIMQHIHHKRRSIWRYTCANADFDTACELLDELDLESIIDDSSRENSWSKWKEPFLDGGGVVKVYASLYN